MPREVDVVFQVKQVLEHVVVPEKQEGAAKNPVVVHPEDLPLTIVYKSKRYVLILTKNDKLILNKATE